MIPFLRQDLAGVRADIARASRNQYVFRDSVIHSTLAIKATSDSLLLSTGFPVCNILAVRPVGNHQETKREYDSVDFREVTKHARGVSRSHTSRRDIFGDDAACPDYSAAANADAGEDDYL